MDITQIMITVGALVGIVVVAALAIVPTLMEIPAPDETAAPHRTRQLRPVRGSVAGPAEPAGHDSDWHLAA